MADVPEGSKSIDEVDTALTVSLRSQPRVPAITFTGRKSGRAYVTPVQYAQQGKMLYIITSEGYTWWKNLHGGAEVQVYMRGKSYPGHAEISTDPPMISTLFQKIYPRLSSQQRTHFAAGKVAITVALQAENEGAR